MNSIDFRKYRAERLADASTQTSDWMRRQSHTSASIQEDLKDDDGIQPELQLLQAEGQSGEELSKEETSPPPLDSSPETLVTLMKSHRSLMLCPAEERRGSSPPGGRPRGASSLLLQLISCGALLFKDGRAHSYSRS
ncbi:hypothetical protein SAY87_025444 [Trapa incisa]|nr:hypothetical protein SAY87_025444 [Trapa incisa]